MADEVGSGDFLPLQSACANCFLSLCVDSYMGVYSMSGSTISVFQGLQLVFKGTKLTPHPKDNTIPTYLKLCSPCGVLFGKLLNLYEEFLKISKIGSYVHKLVYETLDELQEDYFDVKPEPTSENESQEIIETAAHLDIEDPLSLQNDSTFENDVKGECEELQDEVTTRRRSLRLQPLSHREPMKKKRKLMKSAASSFQSKMGLDGRCIIESSDDDETQLSAQSTRKLSKQLDINNQIELKAYQCDSCDEKYSRPWDLAMHKKSKKKRKNSSLEGRLSHSGETDTPLLATQNSLAQCIKKKGKVKKNKKGKRNSASSTFKCVTCGETFSKLYLLVMHEEEHEGKRTIPCTECQARFGTTRNLRRHQKEFHNAVTKKLARHRRPLPDEDMALLRTTDYKCDDEKCMNLSLGLTSYTHWVIHQRDAHQLDVGFKDGESEVALRPRHGVLRPCPQCGRKYRSNTSTVNHIKCVHLRLRPFPCEICGKDFAGPSALEMHVNSTHKGAGQNLCSLCGRTFSQEGGLRRHEKIHYGHTEGLHECAVCHVKISTLTEFRRHTRNHSAKESLFVCDVCGNTFKFLKNLNQHKRLQHFKKYIIDEICELCGKGYAFKKELKEHLMGTHKLSKEAARVSAKIRTNAIFRVLPSGEHEVREKASRSKTCGFCQRTYVRREQLFTHLMAIHGKTEEEAKEITGLKSQRNLIPGSARKKRGQTERERTQHVGQD